MATILKRDGQRVPFDLSKITRAVEKAFHATGEVKEELPKEAEGVSKAVLDGMNQETKQGKPDDQVFTVEHAQDVVEKTLMTLGYYLTARAYITYRNKHQEMRLQRRGVPEKFKQLTTESGKYFASAYEQMIYLRTYSRWKDGEGRRETWVETVDRFMDYMRENLGKKATEEEYSELREAILRLEVMPSMRLLQFSGPAARRNNLCVYNCCFIAPTTLKDISDVMFISMCGTGCGWSVEKKFVDQLPMISMPTGEKLPTYEIPDSKEGWVNSLQMGLESWYSGKDIDFDYSKIRPAGARLITMGGRASGPQPLKDLLSFARGLIFNRQGARLTTFDMHKLLCMIGQVVVCGGVRRCISEGSRVLVRNQSFKDIKDIQVGEQVLTNDGWKPVLNKFKQGTQEVIRVNHQDGYLDCTSNHRLAILQNVKGSIEWKEAGQLKEGDLLAFPMTNSSHQDVYSQEPQIKSVLPPFVYTKPEHSTTCKDITIPPLDEWMAWFLGEFQGDGYVRLTESSGDLSVAVAADDVVQMEQTVAQFERFGINVTTLLPKPEDRCFKVRVKSKQLGTYFHSWLKQPKTTLEVPFCIKMASSRIKACFVQGVMDADGSVKTRPVQIVTTVYEDFAKDIQSLLYSIGIMTRLKHITKASEANPNWQDQYIVCLINRRDKEQFLLMTEGIGYKKLDVGTGLQFTNRWPKSMFGFTNDNRPPKGWSKKVAPNRDHVPLDTTLAFGFKTPLLPTAVISVSTSTRKVPTYDIEVQDNHCFVVEGVLSHNSAMISISDLDDLEIRSCKSGEFWNTCPQLSMANNSAAYNREPTDTEFLEEWLSLIKSGSGERGIFNRTGLKDHLPERRVKMLGDRISTLGTNPCLTGDTMILTSTGLHPVSSLVNKPFTAIVNSQEHPSTEKGFWSTGTKPVFQITLENGLSVKATENHKFCKGDKDNWISLSDLHPGDTLLLPDNHSYQWTNLQGSLHHGGFNAMDVRDDATDFQAQKVISSINVHTDIPMGPSGKIGKMLQNLRLNPVTSGNQEEGSFPFCQGFISGLLDRFGKKNFVPPEEEFKKDFGLEPEEPKAEFKVPEEGPVIELCQANLGRLEMIQRILFAMGIPCEIKKGEKISSLVINPAGCVRFHQVFDYWLAEELEEALKKVPPSDFSSFFRSKITSITELPPTEVYDCSIPNVNCFSANGILSHNCGEVILQSHGLCNLSTIVCRPDDTEESLQRKIRLASIIGTYQSSLTKFHYVSEHFQRVAEEERLLGVSMTGQQDCKVVQCPETLRKLKEVAVQTNVEYAERFGINRSSAVTLVKPEGTVSEMVNAAPGVHARYSPYYIRRVRISAHDPLFKMLRDQGVIYHPEVGQTLENATTYVVEFPIKSPDGIVTRQEFKALEMLEYWKMIKTEYCEHNPSVTVTVDRNEWISVAFWLKSNWSIVGGLSFLPKSDMVYKLAPYEAIDKSQYEKMAAYYEGLKIDFSKLYYYEKEDSGDQRREPACSGGSCTYGS